MKFKITLLVMFPAFLAAAQEDTTYWTSGGLTSATFSQVSLSDSWAAGGSENVAINGVVALFADYKKDRLTWENSLDLGYGLINQNNNGFEKSDDKINFFSKAGYQIKKHHNKWYYSTFLDFKTQFDEGFVQTSDGRDSLISNFMVPGYLTIGMGIDYKPNPKLSLNYVPLTGKFTFVNNQTLADKGAYGVFPGEKYRAELGSFFRLKFKDEVLKNVNFETRLELFTNYIKNFGVIDVNWNNLVNMKINSFLSANWFTQLIYDRDIKTTSDDGTDDAKVQLKSVFGVGLAYNFGAQRAKK